MVGLAVELDQLGGSSAQTPRMVFLVKVSIASVNTERRYFVTSTALLAWMGLIGWTCRQPIGAGCTVRTSTGRRSPVLVLHRSGEAADIRPRGGQWRASRGRRQVTATDPELPES